MAGFDDEEYVSFEEADKAPAAAMEADDPDDSDPDDDLEDAAEDEIDYVLAAYREDGQIHVQALDDELANDLDGLIEQLRRLPGDAGSLGFVSLVDEVFVILRVRGQRVQAILSDSAAAADFPIAHDVLDFLGEDIDVDDLDDEEGEPVGDLDMLTDLGLSEFELGTIVDDLDLGSDQMLGAIADRININPDFSRATEAAFRD
ncbi:tRNA adenosine deaminase-associated protein [Microlunatus flavus]|uniref:Putative tRNA adenosine deaminase-associated protein n=1 Tax=Microlunatus flavus TaxID=1036181 RepID=A0A1H8ZVV7_9ACTN|nr:tRNA adenosine deaminase-associated protein [Microlunatus flavus]SEP68582.1 putative tRNA adenosine deaminase-associated protein [Microlunatus flavus]